MVHSHLFGRANDFCKDIPFSEIGSNDDVDKICKALNKKDGLLVFSNCYSDFLALLSTKCRTSESYRNFESRFAAVSMLNSHASSTLPESFSALILSPNSGIDANQRVSILAEATPQVTTGMSNIADQQFLDSVEYEPIASVLCQCGKPEFSLDTDTVRDNNFMQNPRKRYKYRT